MKPSADKQRPRRGNFLPPRFRSTLPALTKPFDIDMAVSIRAGLRRAINKGDESTAKYLGGLAASFVRRRIVKSGGK